MYADTTQGQSHGFRRPIGYAKEAVAKWSGHGQSAGHTTDTGANNFVNESRHIDGREHRIACGGEYQIAVQCPRLFIDAAIRKKARFEVVFGTEFRKSVERGCDFDYRSEEHTSELQSPDH